MKLPDYIEELDTNTSIDWWNINRERINEVIREYNCLLNELSIRSDLILLKLNSCKKDSEEFSDWQVDILNTIEENLKRFNSQ